MSRAQTRLLLGLMLLALIGAQSWLARQISYYDLPWGGLEEPPGAAEALARGLGDGQFFFRSATLRLQHVGQMDGRMIPWREIDYDDVAGWFALLDRFDTRADIVPAMAAFLYSSTQDDADIPLLVDYLVAHGSRDPARKWRWLATAVHLARHRAGDIDRALEIARLLTAIEAEIPLWARQMEVFVLTGMGEREAARALLVSILQTDASLPDYERRWIETYIRRHLTPPER